MISITFVRKAFRIMYLTNLAMAFDILLWWPTRVRCTVAGWGTWRHKHAWNDDNKLQYYIPQYISTVWTIITLPTFDSSLQLTEHHGASWLFDLRLGNYQRRRWKFLAGGSKVRVPQ